MKDSRRHHGNNALSTIVYLAIYLPILFFAIISIPFGRQKRMVQKDKLEQQLQSCQATLQAQQENLANIDIKLEFYKNENIKKYAAKLNLRKADACQVVYIDRDGKNPSHDCLRQDIQPGKTFQTATADAGGTRFNRN